MYRLLLDRNNFQVRQASKEYGKIGTAPLSVTMKTENNAAIPQIKVGDTAPKFIMALARMNPELQSLFFTIYAPIPGVHERHHGDYGHHRDEHEADQNHQQERRDGPAHG